MKKKSKWKPVLGVICLVAIVIGVLVFYQTREKEPLKVTVLKEIKEYNYKLESNEGKLYESYFEQLAKILEKQPVDEESYVKTVALLFAIDFYTLNNKMTNKDIGGVQFIYQSYQENFQVKASDTVYKYIQSNLYGTRKQSLPEITNIEIEEVKQQKIEYKEVKDDKGYLVKLKLSYSKDLGYPTSITISLLHENKKISITEIK